MEERSVLSRILDSDLVENFYSSEYTRPVGHRKRSSILKRGSSAPHDEEPEENENRRRSNRPSRRISWAKTFQILEYETILNPAGASGGTDACLTEASSEATEGENVNQSLYCLNDETLDNATASSNKKENRTGSTRKRKRSLPTLNASSDADASASASLLKSILNTSKVNVDAIDVNNLTVELPADNSVLSRADTSNVISSEENVCSVTTCSSANMSLTSVFQVDVGTSSCETFQDVTRRMLSDMDLSHAHTAVMDANNSVYRETRRYFEMPMNFSSSTEENSVENEQSKMEATCFDLSNKSMIVDDFEVTPPELQDDITTAPEAAANNCSEFDIMAIPGKHWDDEDGDDADDQQLLVHGSRKSQIINAEPLYHESECLERIDGYSNTTNKILVEEQAIQINDKDLISSENICYEPDLPDNSVLDNLDNTTAMCSIGPVVNIRNEVIDDVAIEKQCVGFINQDTTPDSSDGLVQPPIPDGLNGEDYVRSNSPGIGGSYFPGTVTDKLANYSYDEANLASVAADNALEITAGYPSGEPTGWKSRCDDDNSLDVVDGECCALSGHTEGLVPVCKDTGENNRRLLERLGFINHKDGPDPCQSSPVKSVDARAKPRLNELETERFVKSKELLHDKENIFSSIPDHDYYEIKTDVPPKQVSDNLENRDMRNASHMMPLEALPADSIAHNKPEKENQNITKFVETDLPSYSRLKIDSTVECNEISLPMNATKAECEISADMDLTCQRSVVDVCLRDSICEDDSTSVHRDSGDLINQYNFRDTTLGAWSDVHGISYSCRIPKALTDDKENIPPENIIPKVVAREVTNRIPDPMKMTAVFLPNEYDVSASQEACTPNVSSELPWGSVCVGKGEEKEEVCAMQGLMHPMDLSFKSTVSSFELDQKPSHNPIKSKQDCHDAIIYVIENIEGTTAHDEKVPVDTRDVENDYRCGIGVSTNAPRSPASSLRASNNSEDMYCNSGGGRPCRSNLDDSVKDLDITCYKYKRNVSIMENLSVNDDLQNAEECTTCIPADMDATAAISTGKIRFGEENRIIPFVPTSNLAIDLTVMTGTPMEMTCGFQEQELISKNARSNLEDNKENLLSLSMLSELKEIKALEKDHKRSRAKVNEFNGAEQTSCVVTSTPGECREYDDNSVSSKKSGLDIKAGLFEKCRGAGSPDSTRNEVIMKLKMPIPRGDSRGAVRKGCHRGERCVEEGGNENPTNKDSSQQRVAQKDSSDLPFVFLSGADWNSDAHLKRSALDEALVECSAPKIAKLQNNEIIGGGNLLAKPSDYSDGDSKSEGKASSADKKLTCMAKPDGNEKESSISVVSNSNTDGRQLLSEDMVSNLQVVPMDEQVREEKSICPRALVSNESKKSLCTPAVTSSVGYTVKTVSSTTKSRMTPCIDVIYKLKQERQKIGKRSVLPGIDSDCYNQGAAQFVNHSSVSEAITFSANKSLGISVRSQHEVTPDSSLGIKCSEDKAVNGVAGVALQVSDMQKNMFSDQVSTLGNASNLLRSNLTQCTNESLQLLRASLLEGSLFEETSCLDSIIKGEEAERNRNMVVSQSQLKLSVVSTDVSAGGSVLTDKPSTELPPIPIVKPDHGIHSELIDESGHSPSREHSCSGAVDQVKLDEKTNKESAVCQEETSCLKDTDSPKCENTVSPQRRGCFRDLDPNGVSVGSDPVNYHQGDLGCPSDDAPIVERSIVSELSLHEPLGESQSIPSVDGENNIIQTEESPVNQENHVAEDPRTLPADSSSSSVAEEMVEQKEEGYKDVILNPPIEAVPCDTPLMQDGEEDHDIDDPVLHSTSDRLPEVSKAIEVSETVDDTVAVETVPMKTLLKDVLEESVNLAEVPKAIEVSETVDDSVAVETVPMKTLLKDVLEESVKLAEVPKAIEVSETIDDSVAVETVPIKTLLKDVLEESVKDNVRWTIKEMNETCLVFAFLWDTLIVNIIFEDYIDAIRKRRDEEVAKPISCISIVSQLHNSAHQVARASHRIFFQYLGSNDLSQEFPNSSCIMQLLNKLSAAAEIAESFLLDIECVSIMHKISLDQDDKLIIPINSLNLKSKFRLGLPIELGLYTGGMKISSLEVVFGRDVSESFIQKAISTVKPGKRYIYRIVKAIKEIEQGL